MQPGASASGRPDYDQAIKRLLSRAHDGFLAIIAPGLKWRGERSPELPAIARRADLVWEVEHPDGGRGILHIELQTKVEPDLGERLADYLVRLWRRDHLPVRSVAVLLREARTVPDPAFIIPWGDKVSLLHNFDVIRLWELPQEQVLGTPYYALWPLASLMAGVTTESTVAVAERIAAASASQVERTELTTLLVTLAGIRLKPGELLNALRRNRMIDDLLRESTVVQEWIAEGLAQGREAGKQEGREEGREEGQRQMAQQMAQIALEGRFGPLDADVLAALAAAGEATLRDLVAHVTTDTPEQMRARLGLN